MTEEAATTEAGAVAEPQEGLVVDGDFGDPMYPPSEEAESTSTVTQEGTETTETDSSSEEGAAKPGEAGAEKPSGTEDGGEAGALPEAFDADAYLEGAFSGKVPTTEELAASHKKLMDKTGEQTGANLAIQNRLDSLSEAVRQLASGKTEATGPVTVDQIEELAEARTIEQLGERPDEVEDSAGARKWDGRYNLNATGIQGEHKDTVESRTKKAAGVVQDFLDNNFTDPAMRGAFVAEVDAVMDIGGIDIDQLSSELLGLLSKGWAFGTAVKNAFLDGQQSILDPTNKARKAGSSILAKPGGGKGPAEAGGDTWEKLSADADKGILTGEVYAGRLQKLKDAGVIKK